MSRTLLALMVPQAEPLVGEMRARLDPSARRGLGAHITLGYPWLASWAGGVPVQGRTRDGEGRGWLARSCHSSVVAADQERDAC